MKRDSCTGDVITPPAEEQAYPSVLSDEGAALLKMYPKETVIAEKVHAMISLDLPNSRMKDFFDVFILIRDFSQEIDPVLLSEALARTFEHRKMTMPQEFVRVWTKYFYGDSNKQKQWTAFVKKNRILNKPTLEEVCASIGEYINPLFMNLSEGK